MKHTNRVRIKTVREGDRTRVMAEGEMDLACVVALNRAMSDASSRGGPVDVDLSAVTFADSRFTAAVGGWERNLGRVSVLRPDDQHLQALLALRSRIHERFRTRLARIGSSAEELEDVNTVTSQSGAADASR
jgi:hypothetical protein